MNTVNKDIQKCLPSSVFCLFHDIVSKCSKNSKKEEVECEVVEFDHVCETNDDTDFKIETVDNFPLPFNEFYDSSDNSYKYMIESMFSIFLD